MQIAVEDRNYHISDLCPINLDPKRDETVYYALHFTQQQMYPAVPGHTKTQAALTFFKTFTLFADDIGTSDRNHFDQIFLCLPFPHVLHGWNRSPNEGKWTGGAHRDCLYW